MAPTAKPNPLSRRSRRVAKQNSIKEVKSLSASKIPSVWYVVQVVQMIYRLSGFGSYLNPLLVAMVKDDFVDMCANLNPKPSAEQVSCALYLLENLFQGTRLAFDILNSSDVQKSRLIRQVLCLGLAMDYRGQDDALNRSRIWYGPESAAWCHKLEAEAGKALGCISVGKEVVDNWLSNLEVTTFVPNVKAPTASSPSVYRIGFYAKVVLTHLMPC
ncbi:hypothetical protein D9611_007650 [Ephemerocybe angulata]|uniref:Uncharacterized protein n=1 Tax=Ephemerocybe angulata TaxID=980116 RepID=A0A8H5FCK9_9AGAR|nr:hypothetical protein D9611_007650 [Tulosesus angulatus]